MGWGCYAQPRNFNPRSRVGSDSNGHNIVLPGFKFQSTLPCGERRVAVIMQRLLRLYFNPRSRVGSDIKHEAMYPVQVPISIHAPVWGATFAVFSGVYVVTFQSTLPCGERLFLNRYEQLYSPISIHAPVWGATYGWGSKPLLKFLFQSTLPCGERLFTPDTTNNVPKFQSTLPCGERRNAH